MEWELVWTTGGIYDKSFKKALLSKIGSEYPNNEYRYEYKKITISNYCGTVDNYINLYRIPCTFLTTYFNTSIISQNMRRNLAMIYGHTRREYNVDIFSVILDMFTYLVINDYSLYTCAN